ncbi:MAG: SDR family NAD(P)-dependent oxidoreductase [Deltaproteobacteria bacterium]|nr:SDR family NAD(P)-dependent oxidoreductase [Deltaproteobacteria bacterium]
MINKKILITGCAGFIGSHLSERLLNNGHDVIGIDNLNSFYDPAIKQSNLAAVTRTASAAGRDFAFYQADIRDRDAVSVMFKQHRVDCVVHLAAMAGVRPSLEDPVYYVDVNEMGTTVLLNEANKAGVKNFIFGSSSSVYGNNKKVPFSEDDPVDHPISPYAATKKAGELVCHVFHSLYSMNIACLRFFTVYGPRQRPDLAINKFTHLILKGKPVPVYGDGTKKRDFTYIDDIVAGVDNSISWVCADGGQRYGVFNLGESQTTDVNTLIALIEKTLYKKAVINYLPDAAGDVDTTFAAIAKAKNILGYNPRTKIEEGIKKYVAWVLSQSQNSAKK